jgi:catechol 2,3-dioxygenase-like lactoylglutathione lyase family enzyme
MRVHLGAVSHFNLAVEDPSASATWWASNFDLDERSRSDAGVLLGNGSIMIGLFKGVPDPRPLGHLAFGAPDREALDAALAALRANGVDLEDPGDEIGPVAEGSASVGLWFHDPDGYRFELYVQAPPKS